VTTTRLRRGTAARLFAGSWFQAVLTVVLIADLAIAVVVGWFVGTRVLLAIWPAIPFLLLWLIGLTAHAGIDDATVGWRYYRRYRVAWHDVESLQFGITRGATPSLAEPAIRIRAIGRTHTVVPAFGVRGQRLEEFARPLADLATRAGVAVDVDPNAPWWDTVFGAAPVSPSRAPDTADDGPIRLRRSRFNRAVSGAVLQPLYALFAILLLVRLAISSGSDLVSGGLGCAALIIWLVGAVGYAEADERGLHWRYYRSHRVAWNEIEQVTFGIRSYGTGLRHVIVVRSRGRSHLITPACSSRSTNVMAFARQLLYLAEAHGVATDTHAWARSRFVHD
jgi:hypothetical protein